MITKSCNLQYQGAVSCTSTRSMCSLEITQLPTHRSSNTFGYLMRVPSTALGGGRSLARLVSYLPYYVVSKAFSITLDSFV